VSIQIEKFNEAYIRIKCEPSTAQEISEFFTFEVPGAKFMPTVRNRLWDGRVRLFSPGTGKIYYGLLPYVQKFLKDQGYQVELTDDFDNEKVDPKFTYQFVRSIEKGKFRARDYQLKAIHNIIQNHRGLILSPTGSGKSFIIYALVRYFLHLFGHEKILIVVPTTSLVEQMYSDFADYGWFPDEHCHKLYAGSEKNTKKEVIISTWQSIYKLDKRYFNQFGAVFVDEAHLAKAKSLTGIMTKLHNCKHRIGLTGTLDGTEVHRLVLEGLFSVHEKVTTTSELIERKELSNIHIRVLVLEHTKRNKTLMKGKTYQQEMEYISTHLKRNLFIRNLVCDLKGNTLVLAQYIEKQLMPLCQMIEDYSDENRKIYLIHGATPTDDREEVRRLVEKNDNCIIVASYGTFSTGINIKRIHNIVFASPYKSQIKVLQSIGRGLRLSSDKEQLTLFDLADDIQYNNKVNYTLKHLTDRISIYNEQGFDYDIIPVKLKE
jgi:superfamily II DNA or RNA helicase